MQVHGMTCRILLQTCHPCSRRPTSVYSKRRGESRGNILCDMAKVVRAGLITHHRAYLRPSFEVFAALIRTASPLLLARLSTATPIAPPVRPTMHESIRSSASMSSAARPVAHNIPLDASIHAASWHPAQHTEPRCCDTPCACASPSPCTQSRRHPIVSNIVALSLDGLSRICDGLVGYIRAPVHVVEAEYTTPAQSAVQRSVSPSHRTAVSLFSSSRVSVFARSRLVHSVLASIATSFQTLSCPSF